ncbi:hypothetical protein SAMN05877753_104436 [Bacillus oleivorans]|uniref:Multi-TM2 domain-containing protein n=1 Tax=Bacillus oleivorans TaxID=1448271 RepID=A0A285CV75_9BACI|nr:hypothetical protein [Bacillus oleivorans]SNX70926.1 hypothetical protein SAMN05877753_104436 [Bacillus oleivorans]
MKNPLIAFLLGFFPGGGLLYLGKFLRGLFYMAGVFGGPVLGLILNRIMWIDEFIFLGFGGALVLYIINLIDTAITASKIYQQREEGIASSRNSDSERFYTIILSFVPGLGHFQLGLMNRGITLLAAFLGLGVMVFFVTFLSHRGEFLIFLLLLPVIWFYGFFDAMQLLEKKRRGEELIDRTILEDFENRREEGKKSKAIATFLSIFPGAGHLYLGLQRRGIQLMAAFLFAIYILDVLRLGIFLFLIPIIWFYSFFDGLQKASRSHEVQEDTPIIHYFVNYQKWVGAGLILIGLYYFVANILLPGFAPYLERVFQINFYYWFHQYFQTTIICILLITGGVKLLFGKKKQEVKE